MGTEKKRSIAETKCYRKPFAAKINWRYHQH